MDAFLPMIIGLAIGLVLGAAVGLLIARARSAGSGDGPELLARAVSAEATVVAQREQIERMSAQLESERERAEQDAEEESRVLQALSPVQEQLRSMQAKVAELESQRSVQHGQLSQQLRTALASEENLRATAESLASALRSNSTRGVWGETQLRRLVETAGLLEHVDFSEQLSVKSDAGSGRIDMVVHLSDGKSLAIDAKVPFESFIKANEIPITATGAEAETRSRLLTEHVKAMRGHVDALAKREYWEGLETSPELVIGFIPSESLLSAALETDPGLLDYAFRKNVALASPVTLWAVLKTVAYSWRQEGLSKDAKRLFDLSTELYNRLRVLAEHSESLRRAIESTVSSYNKFSASLETRVLVTARKIVDTGDPSQAIATPSAIESTPRALTASEFQELDPATDEHFVPKAPSADADFELITIDEVAESR